jgi:AcrR family transcriptional regulator
MSSQKSTKAVPPKRQRGRERVAAILDTAAQLFVEQGLAVTMTEIAARSGTAIGSLYRFFPTREALAEVLLQRYADHLHAALDALQARAPGLSAEPLADGLLGLVLDLRTERAAALVLLEQHDVGAQRAELRLAARRGVAEVLRRAGAAGDDAEAAGVAVLTLIKGAATLAMQPDDAAALAELRRALVLYLAPRLAAR